jgi:hypothetical protein
MRRPTLVLSAILLLVAGFAAPAAAQADPPPAAGRSAIDVDALNRQAERLRGVARANPGTAGGSYFDEATGQMVVRYVGEAGLRAMRGGTAGAARQSGEIPIRYERTAVPIATLEAAVDKLNHTRAWAGPAAGRFHLATLNVPRAEVKITVSGEAEQLAAAAARATGVTPRVEIVAGGPVADSRRNDSGLLNGGLAIWDTCAAPTPRDSCPNDVDGFAYCTTGFRMVRDTNSKMMTTAGHCGGDNGENGKVFWHRDRAVARVSSNYLRSGTTGVDIALLGVLDSSDAFSREVWFGEQDATETRPVSAKNTTWPAEGSTVLISGANSGLLRAQVTRVAVTDYTCNVEGPMIQMETEGGYNIGGDSGAPVFAYNPLTSDPDDLRAVGSHSCSDQGAGTTSFSTPIHRIESASGAVIVVGGN